MGARDVNCAHVSVIAGPAARKLSWDTVHAVIEPAPVPELSAAEAAERIGRGELRAVDVREGYEWDAGRIGGATHVPLGDLPRRWGEVEDAAPLLFVCRSGARSALATEAARRAGVEAWNLAGGMQAWAERGLGLEPPGGRVA